MTLEEFNELKKIGASAARRSLIRLSNEQLHDVATAIWESELKFRSNNPMATPDHIRNFRFLKARGAVVEQIWFATWATKGKPAMRLATEQALSHHTISDDRATTFEMAQLLSNSKDGDIVIEYVMGSNMKEIGKRRGVSESAISQRLKEFKLNE